MKCYCIQCLLSPYFAKALERELEKEICKQQPLILGESQEERKINFREFIKNK